MQVASVEHSDSAVFDQWGDVHSSGVSWSAVIGGAFVLRACIVNFRTSLADIQAIPEIVTRLGAELDRELRPQALPAKIR